MQPGTAAAKAALEDQIKPIKRQCGRRPGARSNGLCPDFDVAALIITMQERLPWVGEKSQTGTPPQASRARQDTAGFEVEFDSENAVRAAEGGVLNVAGTMLKDMNDTTRRSPSVKPHLTFSQQSKQHPLHDDAPRAPSQSSNEPSHNDQLLNPRRSHRASTCSSFLPDANLDQAPSTGGRRLQSRLLPQPSSTPSIYSPSYNRTRILDCTREFGTGVEIYVVRKVIRDAPNTSSKAGAASSHPTPAGASDPFDNPKDASPPDTNTNTHSYAASVLQVPVESILEHVSAAELEIFETNAAGRREEEEQKWRAYLRRKAGLRETVSESVSETTSVSGEGNVKKVEKKVKKPTGTGRRGRPPLKKLPVPREEEGTARKKRRVDQSDSQRSSLSAIIPPKAALSGVPVSGPLGRSGITQLARSGPSIGSGSMAKNGTSTTAQRKNVPVAGTEEDDDSEPEYEILRIHNDRLFTAPSSKSSAPRPNVTRKYLVEWKDWPDAQDFTWEPLENLSNAKAELRKYLVAKDSQRRPHEKPGENKRASSGPAEYEVLRIHNDRVSPNPSAVGASNNPDARIKYLVEWKDWPDPNDFTWEPAENFSNAQTELRKYTKAKERKRQLKEKLEENRRKQLGRSMLQEEPARQQPASREVGSDLGIGASRQSSRRSSPRKNANFLTPRGSTMATTREHSKDSFEQNETKITLHDFSRRRKPTAGMSASPSTQDASPSSETGGFSIASALSRFKGGLLGPRGGEQPQESKERGREDGEGDEEVHDGFEVSF
ncbi:MAG: hypothetical protein M1831_007463 [Alyxoria varia]|nr:MAG: hypothetical protein M1831_007463 [Alyxoria varia]